MNRSFYTKLSPTRLDIGEKKKNFPAASVIQEDLYMSKTLCLILATGTGGNQEQFIFDIEPVKMRSELNPGDFKMTEDDLSFIVPQLHFDRNKK